MTGLGRPEGAASDGKSEGARGTVHASAVALADAGILVRGDSGTGKSTVCLALVDGALARGRFAALVADDRVALTPAGGRLIARAPGSLAGRWEARGLGILSVPTLPAVRLSLVVELSHGPVARLPEPAVMHLCGVTLPCLTLPARHTGPNALSLFHHVLGRRA